MRACVTAPNPTRKRAEKLRFQSAFEARPRRRRSQQSVAMTDTPERTRGRLSPAILYGSKDPRQWSSLDVYGNFQYQRGKGAVAGKAVHLCESQKQRQKAMSGASHCENNGRGKCRTSEESMRSGVMFGKLR
eukprot:scaffold565_cov379-Pinguiococcus_pyrenoidosus.AAC.25